MIVVQDTDVFRQGRVTAEAKMSLQILSQYTDKVTHGVCIVAVYVMAVHCLQDLVLCLQIIYSYEE